MNGRVLANMQQKEACPHSQQQYPTPNSNKQSKGQNLSLPPWDSLQAGMVADLTANTDEQELLYVQSFYCSQGVEVGGQCWLDALGFDNILLAPGHHLNKHKGVLTPAAMMERPSAKVTSPLALNNRSEGNSSRTRHTESL